MEIALEQLAKHIKAGLSGDTKLFSRQINSVAPIKSALKNHITFITDDKHKAALLESQAGAVIISKQIENLEMPQLIVSNVNKALIEVLTIFAPKLKEHAPGIHPTALIAEDAKIDKTVSIDAGVIIDKNVIIEANTIIKSGCKIGENSKIGKNCQIDSNVVVYHNCRIGNNVVIQANSTVGSEGFGYTFFEGANHHIPHNGGVIIEDFVEIGANCCIDRAKFDNTIIGAGTKIDNLVQIAHNVIIGKCCLLAGQVGIAGSTKLGDGVVLAGQVGVIDNLKIGNGVIAGVKACIITDVPDGKRMAWSPAYEWNEAMRLMVHVRHLPKMKEQLNNLLNRIKELEAAKNNTK
jgi:UDP-3-O-[3-hydroxymyristoyl] glucosamine N-acyltransferase